MPDQTLRIELTTALGENKLRFGAMSAREELSRPFEFEVIAISEDPNVGTDNDLLGSSASVSIDTGEDTKRWFNGIVAAWGFEGFDGRFFRFRLSLRPWLWLLTRSSNLRIYQGKSTIDIASDVFSAYEHQVDDRTTGSHAARPYCVQYRESDFNFVSRLLEEEGIAYYFAHEQGKHTLVLVDAPGGYVAAAVPDGKVLFLEKNDSLNEEQALHEWAMRHEVQTGKVVVSDYDYLNPSTSLRTTAKSPVHAHPENAREVYDYPAGHATQSAGDAIAGWRVEEHDARFTRYQGRGNVPAIACGTRITLANHPRDELNAEYLVLATHIEMAGAGYESGDHAARFACSLVAQDYGDPFRPARMTRKPEIAGPQTAVVVGASGSEIHTDEHGRVKVQFHWDRLGEKNAQSSCWLRVASPWAGNGWGVIALPRVGDEVVVAFLEGDPDRPLVTGSVYNGAQKTPYVLPDNATVSTIKSRSSTEGGAADFNELRFEDKKGSEYVLLHAQKDRFDFVEADYKLNVGHDHEVMVKKLRKTKVEDASHEHVIGDVAQKYDAGLSQEVGGDMLFKGGGLWSLKVTGDFTVKSDAGVSFDAAADGHVKLGANLGVAAGANVHVKGGANVVIEGAAQVTIKAGGSSVVLGPDGVSITGAMVKINSGGSPGSGSGASPVAPTDPTAPKDPEAPADPLPHR